MYDRAFNGSQNTGLIRDIVSSQDTTRNTMWVY